MAIVQVLDENDRPVFCQVAAISPSTGATLATYTTNNNGQVVVSQSVPWYPRVLVSKDYKSRTKILLFGDGHGACYDYVVDSGGGGTHTTIESLFTTLNALTSGNISVYICPGTFSVQNVPIQLDSSVRVTIHGGGKTWNVQIKSISTVSGSVIFDVKSTGNDLYWEGVGIGDDSVLYPNIYLFKDSTGVNTTMHFTDCRLGGKIGSDWSGSSFQHCDFRHGLKHDSGTPDSTEYRDCDFGSGDGTNSVNFSVSTGQVLFQGCRSNRKWIFTGGVGSMRIVSCIFGTSGAGNTWLHFNGGSHGSIEIVGNDFASPADANGAIYFQSTTGMNSVQIVGNVFGRTIGSTNPYITSADVDTESVIIIGNGFQRDGSGNYVEDSGGVSVSGNFKKSVFGPNTPGNKARYNITGADNEFYPATSASGSSVPTNVLDTKDDGADVVTNTTALDFRSGLRVTLDGTNEADIALGDLTAQYDQNGAFDWVLRGGNLLVANSKKLSLYSDNGAGTPTTPTAIWDATTGHLAINRNGAAAADTASMLRLNGTFSGPTSATQALKADPVFSGFSGAPTLAGIALAPTYTPNANSAMIGRAVSLQAVFNAAFNYTGINSMIFGGVTLQNAAVLDDLRVHDSSVTLVVNASNRIKKLAHYYARNVALGSPAGTVDEQYGLYVENLSSGTLNRVIKSLGGVSEHLGAFTIGANAAPNASAILDLASTTLGLLIPRIATASRPAGVNGLMYYDTTTNKFVAYENGAYTNMIGGGGGGTNALLDGANHTDTAAGTVARGDIITGQTATPKWTRMAKAADRQVLTWDGTDAVQEYVITTGVYASRPAAATAMVGRLYMATDRANTLYRCKDATTWEVVNPRHVTLRWYVDGRLRADTSNSQGPMRYLPDLDGITTETIALWKPVRIKAHLKTASAGAAVTLQIEFGTTTTPGTTLLSSDLSISAGSQEASATSFTDTTIENGTIMELIVKTVGSTAGSEGTDLSVELEFVQQDA